VADSVRVSRFYAKSMIGNLGDNDGAAILDECRKNIGISAALLNGKGRPPAVFKKVIDSLLVVNGLMSNNFKMSTNVQRNAHFTRMLQKIYEVWRRSCRMFSCVGF